MWWFYWFVCPVLSLSFAFICVICMGFELFKQKMASTAKSTHRGVVPIGRQLLEFHLILCSRDILFSNTNSNPILSDRKPFRIKTQPLKSAESTLSTTPRCFGVFVPRACQCSLTLLASEHLQKFTQT